MDHTMTEHSTSDSLGDTSWVQLYRRNVPLIHTSSMSLYVTQFYQAFPLH